MSEETMLHQKIKSLERSLEFYKSRVQLLEANQSKMRDPERVLVCDILANGQLLPDPDGKRYNTRPNDAKWISVEDGLPKTGQIVIAFEPHCLNNPDMGMTLVVVDDTFHEVKRHDGKPWVTHWMPAITPPKQSSEGEE
jgi:hypothetical protein